MTAAADGLLRRAEVLAQLGRLHLDIHRELWLAEADPIASGPALGVAAPVLSLPAYADKRKASTDAAAEAPDIPRGD